MNIARRHPLAPRVLAAAAALAMGGGASAGNVFDPADQPFGYIAPAALSNVRLESGTETLYVPWFENGTYKGDLIATPIDATGTPDLLGPRWRAADRIDGQDWDTGRFIFTTDGLGAATPFRFASLTPAQQTALGSDEIVDFLRGQRDNETANGGSLRHRASVLGALIHTNPAYVGAPNAGHIFDGYPSFVGAHSGRAPRVYIGSEAGMVHGLDAATGDEAFAFVPSTLIDDLAALADDPYSHRYFVDGPLNAGDACVNCPSGSPRWKTILAGGLGAGGKAYFALDVTEADPVTSEDNVAPGGAGRKFLWEFTTADDADLGFAYSRPSIVRIDDGSWVVLVGNGYVNAGSGQAVLYALDAGTGAIVRKLAVTVIGDSPLNPNGLSSPTAVDTDGDWKADVVYAGDIKGNLWKFDVSGAPAGWSVAYGGTPLFSATDVNGAPQAITTAPDVAAHPLGGVLVYLATGRLFDIIDAVSAGEDTVYGLWDNGWAGPDRPVRADLVVQTLTEVTHPSGALTRVASNNPVDYTGTDRGWRVSLPAAERSLQDPSVRAVRLHLTTVDPTMPAGQNWLLELNYLTGGSPSEIAMDVDGDGVVDGGDNVDGNGDGDTTDVVDRVVGRDEGYGLASRPTFAVLGPHSDAVLINHLRAVAPAILLVDPEDPGLLGGHFDLDTSHEIYPFNGGQTDAHQHEWDDKTGMNAVDFMDIYGTCTTRGDPATCTNSVKFDDIDERITDPQQRFYISVGNAALSPGGILEINGQSMSVSAYQARIDAHLAGGKPLPVYQLGPLDALDVEDGVQRLTSYKMLLSAGALLAGGIHGTQTGCVKTNQPGALGEYRNGALLSQAVVADGSGTLPVDPVHHYATSGLLWESTMFWHWKGPCYGDADWQAKWDNCFVDGNLEDCLQLRLRTDEMDKSPDDVSSSDSSSDSESGSEPSSGDDPPSGGIDADPDVSTTVGTGTNGAGRLLWREIMK